MLSPRQMFLLDNACWPIRRAFVYTDGEDRDGFSGIYLVGSTMTGEKSAGARDTDVRLMLSDSKYARLKGAVGMTGIRFLGIAIGQYLAGTTGLPIDFQIQQTSAANETHGGQHRNPLGTRDLDNFIGDGEPLPVQPDALTETEQERVREFLGKLKPKGDRDDG